MTSRTSGGAVLGSATLVAGNGGRKYDTIHSFLAARLPHNTVQPLLTYGTNRMAKQSSQSLSDEQIHQIWHQYLTTGTVPDFVPQAWFENKALRAVAKHLPSDPRCSLCHYPFEGMGGALSKVLLNLEPSDVNPNICNVCERFGLRYQGGAEVNMSMLFADVRGSTTLAEQMPADQFSQLIHRFYRRTTRQIFAAEGWVEKLIGDEVTGLFLPGFVGPDHARVALETAAAILKACGYGQDAEPWIPVGVGVHTGMTYVGSVNVDGGEANITALGDAMNTAARLTSLAGPGEIMFSDDLARAAGIDPEGMPGRTVEVKGRSQPVDVWVADYDRLTRLSLA